MLITGNANTSINYKITRSRTGSFTPTPRDQQIISRNALKLSTDMPTRVFENRQISEASLLDDLVFQHEEVQRLDIMLVVEHLGCRREYQHGFAVLAHRTSSDILVA